MEKHDKRICSVEVKAEDEKCSKVKAESKDKIEVEIEAEVKVKVEFLIF